MESKELNYQKPEAFVYCWTNLTNGMKYVGYHKGSQDDGYICSSQSDKFWNDWKTDEWSRQIIAEGTMNDCIALELAILTSDDLSTYYNNNAGGGVIFNDEVKAKLRAKRKGKTPAKGMKHSKENIEAMSIRNSGSGNPRAKSITTPLGSFKTIKEAAEHHGVSHGTIRWRVKNWSDYNN